MAGEGAGGTQAYVRRCRFIGNSSTLSLHGNHLCLAQGNDVRIENCLFMDGGANATAINQGSRVIAAFRNCTVVTAPSENYALYQSKAGDAASYANCILYPDATRGVAAVNPAWGIFTNSCLADVSLLDSGAGNVSVDPRFVNAAAGDYRLRTSSPLVDGGVTNVQLFYRSDLLGHLHFDGDGNGIAQPDIGCYEMLERFKTLVLILR